MNTATTTTTTLSLNEGFWARRNWYDWLFAAVVACGLLFALQRYFVAGLTAGSVKQ